LGNIVQGMSRRPVGKLRESEGPGLEGADDKAEMRPIRGERFLFYLCAAAVFALDQGSKWVATTWLKPLGSVPLLGKYVSLTYRTNTGAAFGMVPWASQGLELVGTAVVVLLLIYGWRAARGSRALGLALALLLGGAAGNLLDRIRLDYVVDFVDLHFWPVFNVADTAITVGAILFVCTILLGERRDGRREEDN